LTAGEVDRVDPMQITKNFHSILSLPVIATHVTVSLLVHKGLFIRNEIDEDEKEDQRSLELRDIGNVTQESTTSFEYGVKRNYKKEEFNKLKHLPFQLQITFTKPDGMRIIRSITKQQQITFERQKAEEEADLGVLGTNAVQQSANLAYKGDYTRARMKNMSNKAMMSRASKSKPAEEQKKYKGWSLFGKKFEDEMSTVQKSEMDQGLFYDDEDEDDEEKEAPEKPMEIEGIHPLSEQKKTEKQSEKKKVMFKALQARKHSRRDETSNMIYQMKKFNSESNDAEDEDS